MNRERVSQLCLLALLLIEMALPAVGWALPNSWTNNVSGKWETNSNWSLGVAPANSQTSIFITNQFAKTVTIDALTTATTLTISNLTLAGVSGAVNGLAVSN